MTTLTVTETTAYSVEPASSLVNGQNITVIQFAVSNILATAFFDATQFGGSNISNSVLIQGDAGYNQIQVLGISNFSAAGWTFANWNTAVGSDLINLIGGTGGDTIVGSMVNDRIIGGGGADKLYGGDGDDFFNFISGDVVAGEIIDGGNGTDKIVLQDGLYDFRGASITGVEALSFATNPSSQAMLYGNQLGSNNINAISGFTGIDVVTAYAFTTFVPGRGTVSGGVSFLDVTFSRWSADDQITVIGTAYRESLYGSSQNDQIFGYEGNDTLVGGAGNDTVTGGTGSDSLDGGLGIDLAVQSVAANAAMFYRTSQTVNGWTLASGVDVDTVTNVESAQFTDTTITLRQSRCNFNFASTTNDTGATSDFLIYNAAGQFSTFMVQSDAVATTQYLGQADGWAAIANGVGDFNGDGRSDFLTTKAGSILNYNTDGSRNGASVIFLGYVPGWTVKGTGDFDNDGTIDILLQNGSTLALWDMTSSGAVGATIGYGSYAGFDVAAVGDFNRDGRADAFLRDGSGNMVEVFTNGSEAGGTTQFIGTLPNWSIVGSGDFNGDGGGDLLLRDTVGNVITWLTASNGGIVAGYFLGAVPGWSIAGTGDYNGDGTSDVLLQNGGNLVSWDIVNGQLAGSHLVSGTLAGWTVVG